MSDIPTYEDLYKLAFKVALKNGSPYFESQCHVENPMNSIQCVQCCAYGFSVDDESDINFSNKLNFVDGAHFDSLGSMQVVSLNLPRAAYIAIDKTKSDNINDILIASIKELQKTIDRAVEIFKIKKAYMEKQASPFMRQTPIDPNDETKRAPSYADLNKLSYVIGLVGLNEYVQAITGKQLHESNDAVDIGLKLVGSLNLYCGKVGHENDMSISLARTPAETTAQRFAVSDLISYPEHAKKYVKGNIERALRNIEIGIRDVPIEYTNGTHCAVDAPISIYKKAEIEGEFFDILKGGNIFHVWLGDVSPFFTLESIVNEEGVRIPKTESDQDIDQLMKFGMHLAKDTPISYFAFSKDMTICMSCNATTNGINSNCTKCGSNKIDHIARITGYYGVVSGFNEAKKEEVKMRHRYDAKTIVG